MSYNLPFQFPQSPIYRKALEIFTLSKNISQFLVYDMSELNTQGEEHSDIYFTGDIIQKSVSLFPEIVNAESKLFSEEKQKHAASLEHLTILLYNNCLRLEKSAPKGKEFLKLLRNELKRFKKMQGVWLLTL